jgi:maleate isomerase
MSRGRVGVMVPPANPTVEPEMARLLGSRADMHITRFPVRPGLTLAERLEAYNEALPAMACSGPTSSCSCRRTSRG